MTITAIIAEYNPFHNGHAYHLREARRATGADFLVVIMSGNFVQRGEPAVADKYLRARSALLNGADLVLELPVCYASASAEYFAKGSVALLNALGCIDCLCFGSECGDLFALEEISDILASEPPRYRSSLQAALKTGISFPAAREKAIRELLSHDRQDSSLSALLASPNNILGIEYLKALKKSGSLIRPVTFKRMGSDYHDTAAENAFASATALRGVLQRAGDDIRLLDALCRSVPENTRTILKEAYGNTFPVFANDFSPVLQYRLLSARGWEDLARCFDVPEALARRIFQLRYQFTDFDSFVSCVHTRSLTDAHVRRALLHILLDIPADTPGILDCAAYYARLLGLRKSAQPLLNRLKRYGHLPLISKLADARTALTSYESWTSKECQDALAFFETDLRASGLYQTAVTARYHRPAVSEYTRSICILG